MPYVYAWIGSLIVMEGCIYLSIYYYYSPNPRVSRSDFHTFSCVLGASEVVRWEIMLTLVLMLMLELKVG